MYARCVAISIALENRKLNKLPVGHYVIARIKSLTKSYIYWPSMDKDIEKLEKACRGCILTSSKDSTLARNHGLDYTSILWDHQVMYIIW